MKIDWKKIFGIVAIYLWIVIISFFCFSIYQNIPVSTKNQNVEKTEVTQNNTASSTNLSLENDPNVKIEYSTSTVNLCGKDIKVYPTVYLKGIEIWSEFSRIAKNFPETRICSGIINTGDKTDFEITTPYQGIYYLTKESLTINTILNAVYAPSIDGETYTYPWGKEIDIYSNINNVLKTENNPININLCGKDFTYPQTIFIKDINILKRIEEIANKMPKVTKIKVPDQVNKDICTSINENVTSSILNIELNKIDGPWRFNLKINNRKISIFLPGNEISDYGYEWYIPLGPLDKNKACPSCGSVKNTY